MHHHAQIGHKVTPPPTELRGTFNLRNHTHVSQLNWDINQTLKTMHINKQETVSTGQSHLSQHKMNNNTIATNESPIAKTRTSPINEASPLTIQEPLIQIAENESMLHEYQIKDAQNATKASLNMPLCVDGLGPGLSQYRYDLNDLNG